MKNNEPLRVACLTLINAIISTPDDIYFRIHLRNELMRNGLVDVIEVPVPYSDLCNF
jgi:diaphanous 2